MKKLQSILFVILILITISLTACGGGGKVQTPQGSTSQSLERPAPPEEYASKKSPGMSNSDVENGKRIYQVNCASCHGDKGLGDGPSAGMLNPKPQPLATNAPNLSDAYLFWRISEGGLMQPFKSAMPAWKSILKENEIWQVIAYLRKFGAD
jgi:mono/diheme cytochrome c family protein